MKPAAAAGGGQKRRPRGGVGGPQRGGLLLLGARSQGARPPQAVRAALARGPHCLGQAQAQAQLQAQAAPQSWMRVSRRPLMGP